MGFACLGFTQSCLGVLGVGEAADRADRRQRRPPPSTALVAARNPSWTACGTSISRPVMSPAAKICEALVRSRHRRRCSHGARSTPAERFRPVVSACQPIAPTAKVASTRSTASSFSKTIRTPAGAFSNPRIRPKRRCRPGRARQHPDHGGVVPRLGYRGARRPSGTAPWPRSSLSGDQATVIPASKTSAPWSDDTAPGRGPRVPAGRSTCAAFLHPHDCDPCGPKTLATVRRPPTRGPSPARLGQCETPYEQLAPDCTVCSRAGQLDSRQGTSMRSPPNSRGLWSHCSRPDSRVAVKKDAGRGTGSSASGDGHAAWSVHGVLGTPGDRRTVA